MSLKLKLNNKKENKLEEIREELIEAAREENDKIEVKEEYKDKLIGEEKIEELNESESERSYKILKRPKWYKKKVITEVSQEEFNKIMRKKYRWFSVKKWVFILICFSAVGFVIHSNYKSLTKKEMSQKELAKLVNDYNNTSAFPTDGVQTYLGNYLKTISKSKIGLGSGVTNYEVYSNRIYVTYIARKTNTLANVYFTALIKTDKGEGMHNFMLPLKFNPETYGYQPMGDLQISLAKVNNSDKELENPLLSFKDIDKQDKNKEDEVKTYLTNFYTLIFNEKTDYTQFYKGTEKLGDNGAKFDSIKSVEFYKGKNPAGYNVKVVYTLFLKEGISFTTTNYIELEPDGSSWIIKNIL